MMATEQQEEVFRCHAWHYEMVVVTRNIPAASASDAMAHLKSLERKG